jgi:hypothetical protein
MPFGCAAASALQTRDSRLGVTTTLAGNQGDTMRTATRLLKSIGLVIAVCFTTLMGGCSSSSANSSSPYPTKLEPPPGAYRSTFTFLRGEGGFGGISVTPKPIPEGLFSADIRIRLVGLRANTTYLVQRAQEGVGGRPLGADGICQRALALFPWSPNDAAAANFQTVPLPATGPLVTFTTGSSGDGALDFELRTLMIVAGTTNDVMYRLVDNDVAPTTELRSDCMTIMVR